MQGGHQAGADRLQAPSFPPPGRIRQIEMSIPVPIPTPRPERSEEPSPAGKAGPAGLPAEERSCRAALTRLGVDFTDHAPIAEPGGCAIPHPITIIRLSPAITLEPVALVNCRTARALVDFFVAQVPSLAQEHLGQAVQSVRQASAYVCRPRRGTENLSEHAYGNALDIGAFILSDGTTIPVEQQQDRNGKAQKFLDAFRAAACGPFRTVLGPGSDADHADHFHLDMKERRNDYAFCQ